MEVFIQLTFYVGVTAVETAMRISKKIFEGQIIQFSLNQEYDPAQTVESLYETGLSTHHEQMGDTFEYQNNDPDSEEPQLERLIPEHPNGAPTTGTCAPCRQ